MTSNTQYLPGQIINNRFLVLQTISGGKAEVYICFDKEDKREPLYVLKTPRQSLSDVEKMQFLNEIANWVRLGNHPNIVRCFGMEWVNEHPFLILEYVDGDESRSGQIYSAKHSAEFNDTPYRTRGVSLRDWLKSSDHLELRDALLFMIDVCSGLIHAQQIIPGLVHCDLKPENILVTVDLIAKVTDFGAAQFPDMQYKSWSRGDFPAVPKLSGTYAYLSPEQCDEKKLDARSDIYALGCVFYELLTGQFAFDVQGKTLTQVCEIHKNAPLPSLPTFYHSDIHEFVRRCLNKNCEERYPSLETLKNELTHIYKTQFSDLPREPRLQRGYTGVDRHEHFKALVEIGLHVEARHLDDAKSVVWANLCFSHGQECFQKQQYEEALRHFDMALIGGFKGFSYIHTQRGATHFYLGNLQEALSDFRQALEIDPCDAGAYYNQGVVYEANLQYEEAIESYNQAILNDPGYLVAYYNRAKVYEKQHSYDQALLNYDRLLIVAPSSDPIYTDGLLSRGTLCFQTNNTKIALRDYDEYIVLCPQDHRGFANRGMAHEKLGEDDLALADFEKAITLNPCDKEALSSRGFLHMKNQCYSLALQDFQRLIELDPTNDKVYSALGELFSYTQQEDLALANFSRAIELNPKQGENYYNRGRILAQKQELMAALQDFKTAGELLPLYPYAHLGAGAVLLQMGKLEDAYHYYSQAAQLGAPQAHHELHVIRELLNKQTDNPIQKAFWALLHLKNAEELDEFIAQYPFVQHPSFTQEMKYVLDQLEGQHRQDLELRLGWLRQVISDLTPSPLQQTFEVFLEVDTQEELRVKAGLFPAMLTREFINETIQVINEQIPPSVRPKYQQRIEWLQQLAREQGKI